ncbi:MAG: hypothetical protein JNM94_04345 [Phycisphaerae bacterium]|jgi:hypothetical protein|nr:hypothetical protein [Phycisphaerae bacterium]
MQAPQLRKALGELNGLRDLRIEFDFASSCIVKKALLIPEEADGLIKVTDGSHVYIVDAERVSWIEIG